MRASTSHTDRRPLESLHAGALTRFAGQGAVAEGIANWIATASSATPPPSPPTAGRLPADAHAAPRGSDGCPGIERIISNDVTAQEWDHVEACRRCRDSIANHYQSTEPRLRRAYRHLRLTLVDWNPILQFLALLAILFAALWSIQRPPPSAEAISRAGTPPANHLWDRDQLALQLSVKVGWPWSTCGVDPLVINKWLGEGRTRARIERDLRVIEQATRGDETRRHQIAQHWCRSLSMGSMELARQLHKEAALITDPGL